MVENKQVIAKIKAKHPDVPLIYFANGGSSYLERQKDMKVCRSPRNALSLSRTCTRTGSGTGPGANRAGCWRSWPDGAKCVA